jgi:hypothetical protein
LTNAEQWEIWEGSLGHGLNLQFLMCLVNESNFFPLKILNFYAICICVCDTVGWLDVAQKMPRDQRERLHGLSKGRVDDILFGYNEVSVSLILCNLWRNNMPRADHHTTTKSREEKFPNGVVAWF